MSGESGGGPGGELGSQGYNAFGGTRDLSFGGFVDRAFGMDSFNLGHIPDIDPETGRNRNPNPGGGRLMGMFSRGVPTLMDFVPEGAKEPAQTSEEMSGQEQGQSADTAAEQRRQQRRDAAERRRAEAERLAAERLAAERRRQEQERRRAEQERQETLAQSRQEELARVGALTAPRRSDPSVQQAVNEQRRRIPRGRASTILTSGQGVLGTGGIAQPVIKTLLGQ